MENMAGRSSTARDRVPPPRRKNIHAIVHKANNTQSNPMNLSPLPHIYLQPSSGDFPAPLPPQSVGGGGMWGLIHIHIKSTIYTPGWPRAYGAGSRLPMFL